MSNLSNTFKGMLMLSMGVVLYSGNTAWANCSSTDDYPDQIVIATEVFDNSTTDGRIERFYDRDVFKLSLVPRGVYTVSIRGVGADSLESVELRLFDEDGITELDYVTNADGTVQVSFTYENGAAEKDVYLDVRSFAELNNGDYRLSIAEVVITDGDGDGLPRIWEVAYGLNDNSPVGDDGFSGDPDSDGFTNGEELALGTHPKEFSSSFFVQEIEAEEAAITLSFPGVAGRNYRILSRSHMGDAGFVQLGTVEADASGVINFEDIAGVNQASRIYALELIE